MPNIVDKSTVDEASLATQLNSEIPPSAAPVEQDPAELSVKDKRKIFEPGTTEPAPSRHQNAASPLLFSSSAIPPSAEPAEPEAPFGLAATSTDLSAPSYSNSLSPAHDVPEDINLRSPCTSLNTPTNPRGPIELGGQLREFRETQRTQVNRAKIIVSRFEKLLESHFMLPRSRQIAEEALMHYQNIVWCGDLFARHIPDTMMPPNKLQAIEPEKAHQIFVDINARFIFYRLFVKPATLKYEDIKQGDMYVINVGDKLEYIVRNPTGDIVTGILDIKIRGSLTKDILTLLRYTILQATSERGHTDAALELQARSYLWITGNLSKMTTLFSLEDHEIQRLLPEPSAHKRAAVLQVLVNDIINNIEKTGCSDSIRVEMQSIGASSYLRKLKRLAICANQLESLAGTFKLAHDQEQAQAELAFRNVEQTQVRAPETQAERDRAAAMERLVNGAIDVTDLATVLPYVTCIKYLREGKTSNGHNALDAILADADSDVIQVFAQQLMDHASKWGEISRALMVAKANKSLNQPFVDKLYQVIVTQIPRESHAHLSHTLAWAVALHQDPFLRAELITQGAKMLPVVSLMLQEQQVTFAPSPAASSSQTLTISSPSRGGLYPAQAPAPSSSGGFKGFLSSLSSSLSSFSFSAASVYNPDDDDEQPPVLLSSSQGINASRK